MAIVDMPSHFVLHAAEDTGVQDVVSAAVARLWRAPYHVMRKIECRCQDGVLTLLGRVPSHYHKQYAEEVVSDMDGVRDVSNQLEVVTPPQWDLVPAGVWRKERLRRQQS